MSTRAFTPGDLVVSVTGDAAPGDPTTYTDNQASPITLEEIDPTTGAIVQTITLPQTTSTSANGTTEYAISGEYGSSSEGALQLSTDGKSLTIAGYAINAATFNAAEGPNGSNAYGNPALAQTTSIPGGASTAVARVIADIRYDGSTDTSTALYYVDNTNNPRSVVTNDGSAFYLSGQGIKGDTTQGVAYALDGASSATPIDTATDTRTVSIYDGNLYVSTDSKQSLSGAKYTANISEFSGEPTSASTPTVLPGISQSVTLSAGQGNTVNNSSGKVDLSPEGYFFANATTLYVADGGNPKGGTVGDGGLQKWVLTNGAWHLAYTLSAGLNLVPDTASAGTTGLIGLTGQVVGDAVHLYTTNSTLTDTGQTYLYAITDQLSSTTGAGETFTALVTAAADTNIRGIAFAPAACFCAGTLILTDRGNVAVEDLAIGDRLITASGEAAPLRWVARQTVATRFADPLHAWPVRVKAGALAPDQPARDLLLSPDHALFLGGMLVQAGALVNDTSITRERPVSERFTYYNLELDEHALILAEGVPAETFVDNVGRNVFDNAAEHAALYPDAPDIEEMPYPRAKAQRQVLATLRDALAARAVAIGASVASEAA